jgi:hypothetical protein
MRAQDLLADTVLALKPFVGRFLDGFNDENRTKQAAHLPNHVIWALGHVSVFMHHVAGLIDGRPTPEADFVEGDGRAGNAARYDLKTIGYGSQPVGDPSLYPTFARGRAIFEATVDRLAAAVRGAEDAALERQVDWGGTKIGVGLFVSRLVFHCGFHAGEIADLRRALGFEGVIKYKPGQIAHHTSR